MIKVFITGMMPTATNNLGDDAVFFKFCSDLRQVFKKVKITAAIRHLSKEYDEFFKIKSIKNLEYDSRSKSEGKFYFGFNKNDSPNYLNQITDTIKKSDIIFIGGSPFEGVSKENLLYGQATYAVLIATICKVLKKDYIIYGAKFFSIKNEDLRQKAKFVLENAKEVYLREKFSKKVILENKIYPKKYFITGDPVISKEIANLNNKKNNSKENLVGICFRYLYWSWDANTFNKRIVQVQAILERLIEKYDYNIIMIPLQFYDKDTFKTNDLKVMNKLKASFKYKKKLLNFNKKINLSTVINTISKCDFVISNRRHICAFASITGVTPIGLIEKNNYENLYPMMNDLGLSNNLINMEKNSNNHKDNLDRIINKRYNKNDLYKKCKKIFSRNSIFKKNLK